MPKPVLYFEIAAIALATIVLEISYTRIFSYKLVYYFTYVVIGTALLGLGSGGVVVATRPRWRAVPAARTLPWCALAAATSVVVGYLIVAGVQLNTVEMVRALGHGEPRAALVEIAKLALLCGALFAPFFAAGVAIALVFALRADAIPRHYGADLVGAAAGCGAAVALIDGLTPPGCVQLAGAGFALAGLRSASGGVRGLLLVALALASVGVVAPQRLPDPIPDAVKTMAPQAQPDVRFSRWSSVFRVDVLGNYELPQDALQLSHDGLWGAVMPRWDGTAAALATRYTGRIAQVAFAALPPDPHVAIIGAAGGNEVLASLHFGAARVTGVELNPVTVSLLTDHFADYTGRVAYDPRVRFVNAEGRAFFEQTTERYDLVWFVAPDSYAAMNAATAGAFVLSESYLYTAEMIARSLRQLRPGGIVCAQFGEIDFEHKPNRTLRYLLTAREALRRLGVADPSAHLLVGTADGWGPMAATILVKPEPFTPDEVARARSAFGVVPGGRVRYAPGDPPDAAIVARAASMPPAAMPGLEAEYPFRISPVTDDAPFFWHFVSFPHAFGYGPSIGRMGLEEAMGERLLVLLLVFVTAFAAVVLLLPLRQRRDVWRAIPHKGWAAVYFAALGLGFMFFEVTLIQRLTLYLGYPTYSLTVTLFALLVCTGLGCLAADRMVGPVIGTLTRALGVVVVMVLFYRVGLPDLVARTVGAPLAVRVVIAVAVIAPLGLCLGLFMPLGLRTVAAASRHPEEYVSWAWAVNGFCSVMGSSLSTLLSMAFGFDAVLGVAVVVYAVGVLALARVRPMAPTAA